MDLPSPHPQAISGLLQCFETTSITNSRDGADGWVGLDFSGLNDPKALHHFLGARDYLLKASDSNSDDERYDPSRECFMCYREHPTGASDKNKDLGNLGDCTPINATACATAHARGVTAPPAMAPPNPGWSKSKS